MNERIGQLAEQAALLGPSSRIGNTHEATEKFAELIIKDIINVLETENTIRHIAYTTYDSSMVEATVEKSINAITEHYGMKQHHRIKNERTMGRKVSSL
jgi:hypothetical protein